MNLKGRINRVKNHLPQKDERDERNEHLEKVSTWLIKNKHNEYLNSIRKAWRISIKGDEATPSELEEYKRLTKRINEIIDEYSRRDDLA